MAENTVDYGNQTTQRGYALSLRILHWLMALIMISMILAGIWMSWGYLWEDKWPKLRGQLFDYHRGMGFVLLVLVVVRLAVKNLTPAPSPLPASVPPMQQKIAHATHMLLYAALIIHPLFGWYATNLWGVKNITVFGLFDLPTLVEKNRELGNFYLEIHGYIGLAIAALVVLHIAAALRHHFVDKDGVLMRMIKG